MPVAPQPDLDVDVRALRSWQATDEDGDPVLVIKDDDVTIVIDMGRGDSWDAAIRSAERLGAEALTYASRLREARAQQRAAGDDA
ncbi:hypothetical protein OHA72_12100 [Dactylosporangium sp. NBC_01737]|uniref:hypothetical protein n=1 Tax=Dactylosporangium sp. NBC_01737 TaxID=2975959 RepID=UPI002E16877A|nr:hypothetical protein OHA72_12100 [Dactylosporangium sp. NBC_01737]